MIVQYTAVILDIAHCSESF